MRIVFVRAGLKGCNKTITPARTGRRISPGAISLQAGGAAPFSAYCRARQNRRILVPECGVPGP
jgi:hypothetical protein